MIFILNLIVLIYSVIIHEISHGYVAEILGDPTARISKRLTLNPVPHVDPLMTLALPLILILSGSNVVFAAAKPVPVDPFNFKNPKTDMALTAVAGPLANVAIAVVSALVFRILLAFGQNSNDLIYFFSSLLVYAVQINLFLAVFNLLPVPPLDGFKFIGGVLPDNLATEWYSLERYGMIFLIIILFAFPAFIGNIVSPVAENFTKLFLGF